MVCIKLIKSLKSLRPLDGIQLMHREFCHKYLETNKRSNLTNNKEMSRKTSDEFEASAKRFSTIEEFIDFIGEVWRKRKSLDYLHNNADDDKVSLMIFISLKD